MAALLYSFVIAVPGIAAAETARAGAPSPSKKAASSSTKAQASKPSGKTVKAPPRTVSKATAKRKERIQRARGRSRSLPPARSKEQEEAFYAGRFAALVVDAETGQILHEVSADATRHPASLTKMMTLYLLFDALKKGRVRMDTMLPVSAKAASAPPTNISLVPGDRITVRTAVESLVVRSANDAAMVVAEGLGGSQEEFAELMNRKAQELGMTKTRFYNPSGLPDARQVTNAYDMARLGIALRRDFPEYYPFFSIREFTFRNRVYEGHNRLLGRYPGADGIKTGFIGASGFNLVTSCKRGNHRLIGVVLGGRTAASRDRQMMDMLDSVFAGLARDGPQAGASPQADPPS